MTRDQLADHLLETRRYVRSDVAYVESLLRDFDATILLFDDDLHLRGMKVLERLEANIATGVKYIQVDPEVLENYLYNAAFELRLKP